MPDANVPLCSICKKPVVLETDKIDRASPQSGIIFLTQEHDSDIRAAALATGAAAYLLKSKLACELQRTIETAVLNGFQAAPNLSPSQVTTPLT